MNSHTTRQFREFLDALPIYVQHQAREAYRLFRQNPAHPGLRFKQVHKNPDLYSARVGIAYRAVGAMQPNGIVWFWIGSHADYDSLLAQL